MLLRRVWGLALLTGWAWSLSHAQAAGAASPPYEQARQAYAARDFKAAARLFAAAAQAEQSRPAEARSDALLMEARSLAQSGEFEAADGVLKEFVAQNPRSAPGGYLRAYVLHRENRPRESLQEFTRAAAIATPSGEDLRYVGLDYVLLDDYADAIRWLRRAVTMDAKNAEAWYDLGRAYMHQGDFVEAEADFDKVLAIDPQHAKALDNLGLSLEGQNRTEEALEAYGRAIEAQSHAAHPSEQPLLNLGTLLNAKNRSKDAVKPLERAVEIAPRSSRCHEELSRAYLGAQREGPAMEQMEQAVALDPKNPRLHYQLGRLYRKAGMTEKAQGELKHSSELYGTHSAAPEN